MTPRLFFKDELKIAPSEGSAHNIDREIAEFNVSETLREMANTFNKTEERDR